MPVVRSALGVVSGQWLVASLEGRRTEDESRINRIEKSKTCGRKLAGLFVELQSACAS